MESETESLNRINWLMEIEIEFEMDDYRFELDNIFRDATTKIMLAFHEPKKVAIDYFKANEREKDETFFRRTVTAFNVLRENDTSYNALLDVILRGVFYDRLTEGFGDHVEHDNKEKRLLFALDDIRTNRPSIERLIRIYTDQCCQAYR